MIPSGQTFAIVNVTAGILQGTANVTALVSSFTSGYASFIGEPLDRDTGSLGDRRKRARWER